jgi:hypothetical protein
VETLATDTVCGAATTTAAGASTVWTLVTSVVDDWTSAGAEEAIGASDGPSETAGLAGA